MRTRCDSLPPAWAAASAGGSTDHHRRSPAFIPWMSPLASLEVTDIWPQISPRWGHWGHWGHLSFHVKTPQLPSLDLALQAVLVWLSDRWIIMLSSRQEMQPPPPPPPLILRRGANLLCLLSHPTAQLIGDLWNVDLWSGQEPFLDPPPGQYNGRPAIEGNIAQSYSVFIPCFNPGLLDQTYRD